jgi:hypothetical protein
LTEGIHTQFCRRRGYIHNFVEGGDTRFIHFVDGWYTQNTITIILQRDL